ncbi:MAG: MASE3 domain-containing protein [Bacillota bacterium]|nr:MASE3 domain-containing protein [Bacillota bacterium]
MLYKRGTDEKKNYMKILTASGLLLIFIIGSSYFGLTDYRPFHVIFETFSCFIAFSVLIMAVNTYELSKNIPFLFLGIGYGFAGGFNVVHILASNGMGFYYGNTTNLSMILSFISRLIVAVSILICCRLFYKPCKWITPLSIILGFSTLSAVLCAMVFIWNNFPACYISGYGSTPFKIAGEYVISAIVLISILILCGAKKYIEANVHYLLKLYLITSIICNILLTFYSTQSEITNVLAHVLKVVSFYFIYRAIVKVGLKTPYKLLFNEINQKNNYLKDKETELEQAVLQLQKENQLRRNVEKAFFENEACYKLLIENSKDAIVIYSFGKIVFANEGASRLVGIGEPAELLGNEVTKLFPLNMRMSTPRGFNKRYTDKIISPAYEIEVPGINGITSHVEVTSANITYENSPAVLCLIRDISPSKQIEKLKKDVEADKQLLNETLEFNRLVTEFFSNISHELRTPLNVILSALQVLDLEENKPLYEADKEKKSRYIQNIKQNCYRLLRLINNLIDISRIDSGYITPRLQNHNIVTVVEDITLSVAEYIENKGIRFIFDTDAEEKILACDPEKIERIMLNLLSNAVKFTNTGGQITVEFNDLGSSVQISVRDTGIGIPENRLTDIFERFRQVDSSLSRSCEGSGIGLSLVKALVEIHGGKITVNSILGEGSQFIITLPSRKVNDSDTLENNLIHQSNTEKIFIEFSDI